MDDSIYERPLLADSASIMMLVLVVVVLTTAEVVLILLAIVVEAFAFNDDDNNNAFDDWRLDSSVRLSPGSFGGGLRRTLSSSVFLYKDKSRYAAMVSVKTAEVAAAV